MVVLLPDSWMQMQMYAEFAYVGSSGAQLYASREFRAALEAGLAIPYGIHTITAKHAPMVDGTPPPPVEVPTAQPKPRCSTTCGACKIISVVDDDGRIPTLFLNASSNSVKNPDYITRPDKVLVQLQPLQSTVILREGEMEDFKSATSDLMLPASVLTKEKQKAQKVNELNVPAYPIIYDLVVAVSAEARAAGILPGMWVVTRGIKQAEKYIYRGKELMQISAFDVLCIAEGYRNDKIRDEFDFSQTVDAPAA